jgi:quercetin dioxygenase-like cupin family protein
MRRSRIALCTLCVLGGMALGIGTGNVRSQAPAAVPAPAPQGAAPAAQGRGPAARPLIDAQNLRMMAEQRDPHVTVPVFGSERAEGYYIVGTHFNPRQTSRPHYHDKDRWITVVSGTWCTGEGDVFRPETMVGLKPGSVMYHPAGFHHYDGSCDDQEVQLLIAGYGPVTTVQTEVDAQGNRVIRGSGGNRGAAPTDAGRGAPPAGRQ